MKRPEILMSADWPEPDSRMTALSNLRRAPTLTLYWPVAYLPEHMGWLPTAEKLEDDPSGQYYLKTDSTFYVDGLTLYGSILTEDGDCPSATISYDDLERLIREADTAVRRSVDSPPWLLVYREHEFYDNADALHIRRYAGRLRVIDEHKKPVTQWGPSYQGAPFKRFTGQSVAGQRERTSPCKARTR